MAKGIAGAVATAGKLLNVKDAYEVRSAGPWANPPVRDPDTAPGRPQDERFNQKFDHETGYKTTSILCMPITGSDDQVLGVIQVHRPCPTLAKGVTPGFDAQRSSSTRWRAGSSPHSSGMTRRS